MSKLLRPLVVIVDDEILIPCRRSPLDPQLMVCIAFSGLLRGRQLGGATGWKDTPTPTA